MLTVSTLTRMTCPTRRTMYSLFVFPVRVALDAALPVLRDLVNDPFHGRPVPRAVFKRLGRIVASVSDDA